MSQDESKAVVRRSIEILDSRDPEALEEAWSPEMAAMWRAVLASLPFSEHRIKITDLVAEGDKVAIRIATSGVHTGEWEGVPPTGRSWTNTGMAFLRVEGGKVVECEPLFDELGHLKQLGATITPGQE